MEFTSYKGFSIQFIQKTGFYSLLSDGSSLGLFETITEAKEYADWVLEDLKIEARKTAKY
jgi:hypothetical protein